MEGTEATQPMRELYLEIIGLLLAKSLIDIGGMRLGARRLGLWEVRWRVSLGHLFPGQLS